MEASNLHKNFLHFVAGEGVMESVTQEDDERETFPLLVRSLGGFWRVDTGQFVQHPVRRSIETLEMLLLTARHGFRSALPSETMTHQFPAAWFEEKIL